MVAVPYARARNDLCAVRTLRAYLEAAGIHRRPGCSDRLRRGETPLTDQRLSDQSVTLIVKRRARAAGVPAAELLRPLAAQDPQRHPGHKNLPRPARYIRTATAFDDAGDVL